MRPFEQKIRVFLGQFALALFLMTLCRIAFYAYNSKHFHNVTLGEFTSGIRFDFSALFWLLLPFLVLSILHLVIRLNPIFDKIRFWLFQAGMFLAILFNLLDLEYFRFTLKRSTSDLFALAGFGDDMSTLIPKFLIEFWYIDLLFILMMAGSVLTYKRIEAYEYKGPLRERHAIQKFFVALMLAAFFFIGGRGGLQLIPLSLVDASMYTTPQNVPLVLNTPFAIMRTLGKKGLKNPSFFEEDQLEFSPVHPLKSDSTFNSRNIVIIILESFSMEFCGEDAKSVSLTPFLQELKSRSTFYPNCYANGKRSIDAVPAILSGIPSLMTEPLISSNFGANKVESFATYLDPKGYHTSFFHGGKNGTMNFNGFVSAAGFDKYYGKDEYGNDNDYDGTWGIFDEPYLQYFANKLDGTPEPFLSTVFTLTSHHPYPIPEKYKGQFTAGTRPIELTVQYTDMALRKFFETASKMSWYENTLFVITADHSPHSNNKFYQGLNGMFRIPLFVFDPQNQKAKRDNQIAQQMDILPTVLNHLNYSGNVFSYGRNLNDSREAYAVQFLNGTYQIVLGEHLYQMTDNGPLGCYSYQTDSMLTNNLLKTGACADHEYMLKQIIQSHHTRMINNNLSSR